MALLQPDGLGRVRTGNLLGIFASAYVSVFLLALMAEQMGTQQQSIDDLVFLFPAVLVVACGLAIVADNGREFYAAGRSINAFFSGLALAVSAVGGVGTICFTGVVFKIGLDGLTLGSGWVAGLVIAGVMLFPFLRKCGAYTVPSFLGLRLDSRIVRMVAALVAIVPTLLLLGAELNIAAFVIAWMTNNPAAMMVPIVAALATVAAIGGGMRALTWVSVAEAIAVLIAIVVPAMIVSLLVSNLPVPQLMHGNLVRYLTRIEAAQEFGPHAAMVLGFVMPKWDLEPFSEAFLQPYSHVGRLAQPMVTLVIATGIASLPAVLNRAGTTPTVYEARKSVGWGVLIAAFMLLTLVSIAVFMRGYVVEQVVNAMADHLPVWFQTLEQWGYATVGKTSGIVAETDVAMKRDIAFLALPMVAGLPRALIVLVGMGAIAAALAAASAHLAALAGIVSEDLLHGGRREPPEEGVRLWSARLATVGAGAAGVVLAWIIPDPLKSALAALTLSAATLFPVLVMSVLWRKVSRTGAVIGMLTGFGVTLLLMLASAAGGAGSIVLAAVIGGPANFFVIAALSELAPLKTRRALEAVRDLRLPGGEATYDREMRLLRRKRATQGG